jgi:hypothetical protein
VTETYGTSQASPAAPGAPHDTFSSTINERDGSESVMNCNTSISTLSTPELCSANTNVDFSLRHKHNINITNKTEEEKRETLTHSSGNRGYRSTIWVNRDSWLKFIQLSKQLGYSASEIINSFIESVVNASDFQLCRSPLNFNIAIAKAESKPFINVGEYLLMNEVDELLKKGRKLKERAERETQLSGSPLTFTVEQAKKLEEALIKSLRNVKHLPPEKFREVEAALTILRSIREGLK